MPGDSFYQLDPSVVAEIIQRMGTATTNIQESLATMSTKLETHLLPEWTGDADQAYFAQKAQWDAPATNMVSNLNEAATALNKIVAGYSNAAEANTKRWNNFVNVR